MSLNTWGLWALAITLVAWPLWLYYEVLNWTVWLRLMMGFTVIVATSSVFVAFCQLKAATKEHYYRDALLSVSRMTASGNTKVVADALKTYAETAASSLDILPVRELSESLSQQRQGGGVQGGGVSPQE